MIDRHYSAYRGEIVNYLRLKPGSIFLDLTLGDGGHTEEALKAGCSVISVDVDKESIKRATSFIKDFSPVVLNLDDQSQEIPSDFNWIIVNSNFTHISEIFKKFALPKVDAIMVDLGPSQYQILAEGRGFSFSNDEPLDMRLDPSLGVTAKDLLAVLNEGEIREMLELSDEPFARPLARAICKERQVHPITTTKQLVDIIQKVKRHQKSGIHPATQSFMALRMAVNLEREVIKETLPQLPEILNSNGILGVISFHSGEDRLVKEFMKSAEQNNQLSVINQKPIEPSKIELTKTNRTRSAKLRLAQKQN